MIGAGTIISPILKVVTTVAILGACYLFFVKPALDTTETISGDVSRSIGNSFDSSNNLQNDIQKDVQRNIRQAQRQARQATRGAFQSSGATTSISDASKLLDCIGKAAGDVNKITACNEKFAP